MSKTSDGLTYGSAEHAEVWKPEWVTLYTCYKQNTEEQENGCVIWTGAAKKRVRREGAMEKWMYNRIAYFVHHMQTTRMDIDTTCGEPWCVAEDHLYIPTAVEDLEVVFRSYTTEMDGHLVWTGKFYGVDTNRSAKQGRYYYRDPETGKVISMTARRLSWLIAHGEEPKRGLNSKCGYEMCVAPEHLEYV